MQKVLEMRRVAQPVLLEVQLCKCGITVPRPHFIEGTAGWAGIKVISH